MNLTFAKATNFLVFKEVYYKFQQGVPVLIKGENFTNDGQESNGSGKSAIGNIIEYCWLHDTSRKDPDAKLVHRGEIEAYVSIGIHCPIRNEELIIERTISVKNGSQSALSLNGEPVYTFSDRMTDAIDKYIIEWIGISKEDVRNYFLITKDKYKSFFSSSNTELVNLIGRFSNSNIIQGIEKDVLVDAEKIERQVELIANSRSKLQGNLEVYIKNLEDEQNVDFEALRKQELEQFDSLISNANSDKNRKQESITQKQEEILSYKNDLKGKLEALNVANGKLQAFKTVVFEDKYAGIDEKLSDVKNKKQQQQQEQLQYEKNVRDTNEILIDIERNIMGSVTCPKCSHRFVIGKEEIDIQAEIIAAEETKSLMESLNVAILKSKELIDGLDKDLIAYRKDRGLIEAEENLHNTQKRACQNAVNEVEIAKQNIEHKIKLCELDVINYEKAVTSFDVSIESYKRAKVEIATKQYDNTDKLEAIRQSIAECEEEIVTLNNREDEYKVRILNIKQWSEVFKQFRQDISSKTLKVLEGYANLLLEDLQVDMRVSLSGFKLKADGTLSDKITATVIRDGEENGIGHHSGGERARLEAAMILTVQRAINSTHKFGGLDFVLIDEVLDSTDGLGITNLMKSFTLLNKTIMLVTHIPVHSFEFKSINVVKRNNISYIEEGAN